MFGEGGASVITPKARRGEPDTGKLDALSRNSLGSPAMLALMGSSSRPETCSCELHPLHLSSSEIQAWLGGRKGQEWGAEAVTAVTAR